MVTGTTHDILAETLFGKARRSILALLYTHIDKQYYLRQIARETGVGLGPAQRELKLLTAAGIIERQGRDKMVYYQANAGCPVFNELKSMADKCIFSDAEQHLNEGIPRIKMPRARITGFCRRHHIKKLSLFGSVLTDAFTSDSDIDVLVEFEPGHTPGWDIVTVENELSSILGRKADLHTKDDLSRYFRDKVVREAQVQYAAK